MNNFIEVDIKDKEALFNSFNNNQISEELGNYILKNAKNIPLNLKMIIYISDRGSLSKEEREHLVASIRTYYGLLVKEKLLYTKFNKIKNLMLFIIGIVLILLSNALNNIFSLLIPELFLIAGWVAIWETVYGILFIDNKNRIEIKKAKALSKCEIRFNGSK